VSVLFDCNLTLAGVQTLCAASPGTAIDIGILVLNGGGAPVTIGAVTFEVHNTDRGKLRPVLSADQNMDGNPDWSDVPGDWRCNPPPPQPNTGEDGPATSVSKIFCIQDHVGRLESAPLAVDASLQVAVVHYTVPPAPGTGSTLLSLGDVSVRDATGFIEIASCAPVLIAPAAECGGSTVTMSCPGDGDCDGFADAQQTLHLAPANTNTARDNCPSAYNPDQLNTDGNFIDNSPPYGTLNDDKTLANSDAAGDACDADDDNDSRGDADEASGAGCGGIVTNPLLRDTDGDRALDGPECALGKDPTSPASAPLLTDCGPVSLDLDGDKIPDRIEWCYYNSAQPGPPVGPDVDADGARDGCEIASFNADQIVNSLDQGMLGSGIAAGGVGYTVNVDVNKDGVLNSIDQGTVGSLIIPPGQCP
jgi:hypothetical protein